MSVIEIYKPTFGEFHDKPIVTWQESNGPLRVATDMFKQYANWLNAWTDPFRDKHAPGPAFWETNGPAICRALRHCFCVALVFEYETDRKVAYRWFSGVRANPVAVKSNDWYSLCSVTAEGGHNGADTRVTVTLPTDEDVVFMFHHRQMQKWLRPPPEAK